MVMEEENNKNTEIVKKAKVILFDKLFGKVISTNIIEITDEIDQRWRIIEELAAMSLETFPMLHPKEGKEKIPFVEWSEEDFENEENTKINEVLEKKEEEFTAIFSKLIIEKLNLKLKKNQMIFFGDSKRILPEEKVENICIHQEIEIYTKK